MNRSMDEIREELQGIAKQSTNDAITRIMNIKEEILIAFIAKYGCQPDEAVFCYEGTKYWVEKRVGDGEGAI